MTIDKVNNIRKLIDNIHKKKLSMIDLDIIYELDCQLGYPDNKEYNLNDEDYLKLYEEVNYAYLKVDGIGLDSIVSCALDHVDDILKDNEDFNLREESCYYGI